MALNSAMDLSSLTLVMRGVCTSMIDAVDDFTHADQAIGDGDHGLAIGRGFRAANEFIGGQDHADVGGLLEGMGAAILMSMGGASGAIYGTLFRRGGHALVGRKIFDSEALAVFLEEGLVGVCERGGAHLGDKTMVDALEPAAAAARYSVGNPISDALVVVAEAARAGARSTTEMRASHGRAKALGDRALGHVDPGALSFASLIEGMCRLAGEVRGSEAHS